MNFKRFVRLPRNKRKEATTSDEKRLKESKKKMNLIKQRSIIFLRHNYQSFAILEWFSVSQFLGYGFNGFWIHDSIFDGQQFHA